MMSGDETDSHSCGVAPSPQEQGGARNGIGKGKSREKRKGVPSGLAQRFFTPTRRVFTCGWREAKESSKTNVLKGGAWGTY